MNKIKMILAFIVLLLVLSPINTTMGLRKTYSTDVTSKNGSVYHVELIMDSTFHKGQDYWVWANVSSNSFGKDVTRIDQIDLSINIFKQKPSAPDKLDHDNYITGGLKTLSFQSIYVFNGTYFYKSGNVTIDISDLESDQTYFANVLLFVNEIVFDTTTNSTVSISNTLLVWEGWISGEDYSSQQGETENAAFPIRDSFIGLLIITALFVVYRKRAFNLRVK